MARKSRKNAAAELDHIVELQVHGIARLSGQFFLISSQYRRAACSVLLSPYW